MRKEEIIVREKNFRFTCKLAREKRSCFGLILYSQIINVSLLNAAKI